MEEARAVYKAQMRELGAMLGQGEALDAAKTLLVDEDSWLLVGAERANNGTEARAEGCESYLQVKV